MRYIIGVLCLTVFAIGGCSDTAGPGAKPKAKAPPPVPVTVAHPIAKKITEWDEFTGRFVAVEAVEVRARVSGHLEKIAFKDGQIIKKGDLLFVIDPRPFKIALDQANAEVTRAQSEVIPAENDVERGEPLVSKKMVSQSEFESRVARLEAAKASLLSARAAKRKAELDLQWTNVRAKVSGRISDARVDVGNLISGGQATSTVLTTIVSLNPIHFEFEGSESDYLKYTRLANAGKRPSSRDEQNPVAVKLADEDNFGHTGKMEFVDNAIDPRSGTIRGRAVLKNPDFLLVPGMFGRMRLFGGQFEALLIPDDVILSDQARKIVLSVDKEGAVTPTVVKLGPIVYGLRVVRSGLSKDDTIIIKGVQRFRPGLKVKPEVSEIKLLRSAEQMELN